MTPELQAALDNCTLQQIELYLSNRKVGVLGTLENELMPIIQKIHDDKWNIQWLKRIREVTGYSLLDAIDYLNTLLKKAGWKKGIGVGGNW